LDILNGQDRLDDVLVEWTIRLTLKWLFRHWEAVHSSPFLLAKQHIDLPPLMFYAVIIIFFIIIIIHRRRYCQCYYCYCCVEVTRLTLCGVASSVSNDYLARGQWTKIGLLGEVWTWG
jgi:hypothetical protein